MGPPYWVPPKGVPYVCVYIFEHTKALAFVCDDVCAAKQHTLSMLPPLGGSMRYNMHVPPLGGTCTRFATTPVGGCCLKHITPFGCNMR